MRSPRGWLPTHWSCQRGNWFKYGPTALFRFCWLGTEKDAGAAAAREPCRDSLKPINRVLDLSKIEAGKLELNPQTVQLAPLIDKVVGTAPQLAEVG